MNREISVHSIPTPLGDFFLACQGESIIRASFDSSFISLIANKETPLSLKARKQLAEYFQGERPIFDLPLEPEGTAFLKKIWEMVKTIPAGETMSYSKLATLAGIRNGSRAIGLAMAKNPILIFIPCHRVVSSGSSLTGYAGGIDRKRKLLELERRFRTQKEAGLLFYD